MARDTSDMHTSFDTDLNTDSARRGGEDHGDTRRDRPARDRGPRRAEDQRRDPAPPPRREPRYLDGDLLHG
jgi:hypothetical protein